MKENIRLLCCIETLRTLTTRQLEQEAQLSQSDRPTSYVNEFDIRYDTKINVRSKADEMIRLI